MKLSVIKWWQQSYLFSFFSLSQALISFYNQYIMTSPVLKQPVVSKSFSRSEGRMWDSRGRWLPTDETTWAEWAHWLSLATSAELSSKYVRMSQIQVRKKSTLFFSNWEEKTVLTSDVYWDRQLCLWNPVKKIYISTINWIWSFLHFFKHLVVKTSKVCSSWQHEAEEELWAEAADVSSCCSSTQRASCCW